MTLNRRSRVGFAVLKFGANGASYYLMRINSKWRDVNFIGGHEKPRDGGQLEKTARRELWEEVPSFRSYSNYTMRPLTGLVTHGPILSRSKGDWVEYEAQFFLLNIEKSPETLIQQLSSKSKNVWIPETELVHPMNFRLSGLVEVLKRELGGRFSDIPLSWPGDLAELQGYFWRTDGKQLELALK